MVAGSIPVRRSWTSLPGGLFLHHFEGGSLPLAPAALSAKHSGCHPREGGDLFCASKPSSATPSAGPQTPARNSPASHTNVTLEERSDDRVQNRFICHPERSAKHEVEGSRTASWKLVCFEWHFARSHIHFVRVLSLRNASSPQRNTRRALLGDVTARDV